MLLDIFIIMIAKYSESSYDSRIKQTLNKLKGGLAEGDDMMGSALNKADTMLNALDSFTGNSMIKNF